MCLIFLYLLTPRLHLPVPSPPENMHCFLCSVYPNKPLWASIDGYNTSSSCVLTLCQVRTWVPINSLNSYTIQEKSVAFSNYHGVHMEHSKISQFSSTGEQALDSLLWLPTLDTFMHIPKTDLHLRLYSTEKKLIKKSLGTRQTKIIPSKRNPLWTLCDVGLIPDTQYLGGLTYKEVASLGSWQAALVDSGTLGLFLESRGTELAISILNPGGMASWVLITTRAT